MTATTKTLRYQLPRKAVKGDCPQCGARHRETLSRYIDTQTGDPLPEAYGRCDRESNCGYHLNPYHKGASGLSYHDEQKALNGIGPIPKDWFRCAGKLKRNGSYKQGAVQWLMEIKGATLEQAERAVNYVYDKPAFPTQATPSDVSICTIPEEVFQASLGYYEQNQLVKLLDRHVGAEVTNVLLDRFQIGTSSRWPGACVFWCIDELGRIRGGQIKLFGEDFHTVKYQDKEGRTRSKTSWVHAALIRRYTQKQEPVPAWLTEYDEKAERSPCLFGLSQLKTAPIDQPIAIVEAPKTAILCSHYFPDFVWMAAGGKSYLTSGRLVPLKGRKIALFPDLNAYHDLINEKGQINKGWLSRARELQAQGLDLTVSDYLEKLATEEDRAKGLDLADYLLRASADISSDCEHTSTASRVQPTVTDMAKAIVSTLDDWAATPGSILKPNESQIERLAVEPCDTYPADWDESSPADAVPILKPMSFFEWQRSKESPFSKLGLASLPHKQ